MKDFLMMCANIMIALYIPYEIGRMLVEGVSRKVMNQQVGLSDVDSVARIGNKAWIVRGGVFVSRLRKDLCGLAAMLFCLGMLTGASAGLGVMSLLWFIELLLLAVWIDWNRDNAPASSGNSVSMNNQQKRGVLVKAIKEGVKRKRETSKHKRVTAH